MPVERFSSGGIYEDEVGYSRVVVASGYGGHTGWTAGTTAMVNGVVAHPGDAQAQAAGRLPGRPVRPRAGGVLARRHGPDPDVRGRRRRQCRRRGSGARRSSSAPSDRRPRWSASARWSIPRCSSRSRSSRGGRRTTRRPEAGGARRRAEPSGCRVCGRVGPHDEGGTPCRTRRPTGSRRTWARTARRARSRVVAVARDAGDGRATGPRDGAPGGDETLTLPVETPEPRRRGRAGPELGAGPDCRRPSRCRSRARARATEPEPEPTAEPEPAPEPARPSPARGPRTAPAVAGAARRRLAQPGTPRCRARGARGSGSANEAIPAVPPEAGTGPIGSIPAAQARAVWSRLQASNWRLFLDPVPQRRAGGRGHRGDRPGAGLHRLALGGRSSGSRSSSAC